MPTHPTLLHNVVPFPGPAEGLDRYARLASLSRRLDRATVHILDDLADLAWSGPAADRARTRLRCCTIELAAAADGVRRATHPCSFGLDPDPDAA